MINDNELIRRNGSVLEIHDIKSLSKYLWKLYHLLPEDDYQDPDKLGEVKKRSIQNLEELNMNTFQKRS